MRNVVKRIAKELRICTPLEYDEPDPAPDFDDDENDDDESGPIDVPEESFRAAGAVRKQAH